MAGKPRWLITREDGVLTAQLRSWTVFGDFLRVHVLRLPHYIYRGHARAEWRLEPALDRILPYRGAPADIRKRADHLRAFQLATRGRRGPNAITPPTEEEWWALGQHHGLATPLLDWTRSPYVAAYFAFWHPNLPHAKYRVVFALQSGIIANYCNGGAHIEGYANRITPPGGVPLGPDERVDTFTPQSDDNPRLVSQSGVFTRAPDGREIEDWVRDHFSGIKKGILVKVLIPERDRTECLQSLNRMNINHLSLFPDLYGSSKYCNLALSIPSY